MHSGGFVWEDFFVILTQYKEKSSDGRFKIRSAIFYTRLLAILEQSEEVKYEYVDGYLYAMAGGSIKHNQIGRNLIISIGSRLRAGDDSCQVVGSHQKIRIESRNSYLMPDLSAVCGEIETDSEDENAIVNPRLIIEVLSKSTMGYDKTQKFSFYRTLTSLQEYMMIWQNDPIIETYTKLAGGTWEIAS